jgi:NTP pyrophosphatase (non-canonical NTP hydrolase)
LVINLSQLQQRLRKFAEAREWEQFHSPKNLACALSVEASELLEHFQWMKDEESRTLPEDKLLEVEAEIADIFCYLLMISDKLSVDLIEATNKKIVSNESRYPIDKSKGRSDKYTKL